MGTSATHPEVLEARLHQARDPNIDNAPIDASDVLGNIKMSWLQLSRSSSSFMAVNKQLFVHYRHLLYGVWIGTFTHS